MCVTPNTLSDGTQTACHKCWQCREQAVNDWVGRNIAESKTAIACHAVTLTYGRGRAGDVDHERASVLTYSDVQKYLKLLRRHGYPVRYFVTGEYGSKKGRAHWHIMLYWQKHVPRHLLDENYIEDHWPHGWSFWTVPTPHAVRYNCKYIQKDMGEAGRQGHLAMSKKPPLGTAFFQQMAAQYVEQGLAPQTLEYRFAEVTRRKKDGSKESVPFMLKDRPAELFLEYYLHLWRSRHGERPWPKSQLLAEYLDPDEKKRRKILEWFAELPPKGNLDAGQRLQVEKFREELDKLNDPDAGGHALTPYTGARWSDAGDPHVGGWALDEQGAHAPPSVEKETHIRKVRWRNAQEPTGGYDPVFYADEHGEVKTKWVWQERNRANG